MIPMVDPESYKSFHDSDDLLLIGGIQNPSDHAMIPSIPSRDETPHAHPACLIEVPVHPVTVPIP